MILTTSKTTSFSQGTELLRILKFLHKDFIVKKKIALFLMDNLGYSHVTLGGEG